MADVFNADDLAAARSILADCLVWDNHACMPLRPADETFLPQLERLRAIGVDVVSLNIGFGDIDLLTHLRMIAKFRHWIAARGDRYLLIDGVGDIDTARVQGKMAITFDIEGMKPFDDGDHGLVEMFATLGVRWMLVAYNRANAAGSGCFDDEDNGLTMHGRAQLAEMRRVGIVACCSHTGRRTVLDVIDHADNPVIFSHSNANAVHPHRRNISDDLIRACAATGGVVGVNGIADFVGSIDGQPDDRPETMLRHMDHMVQLVGPDHVGIAFDHVFDTQEIADYFATMHVSFPEEAGWAKAFRQMPPEGLVPLVAGMRRLGYPRADIAKILGGNWCRVAARVWKR